MSGEAKNCRRHFRCTFSKNPFPHQCERVSSCHYWCGNVYLMYLPQTTSFSLTTNLVDLFKSLQWQANRLLSNRFSFFFSHYTEQVRLPCNSTANDAAGSVPQVIRLWFVQNTPGPSALGSEQRCRLYGILSAAQHCQAFLRSKRDIHLERTAFVRLCQPGYRRK